MGWTHDKKERYHVEFQLHTYSMRMNHIIQGAGYIFFCSPDELSVSTGDIFRPILSTGYLSKMTTVKFDIVIVSMTLIEIVRDPLRFV